MIATSMIRTVPRIYKQKRQISKNTLKVGRLNAVTLHDLDNLPDDNSVYLTTVITGMVCIPYRRNRMMIFPRILS